jgi:hypothetical protein
VRKANCNTHLYIPSPSHFMYTAHWCMTILTDNKINTKLFIVMRTIYNFLGK